MRSGFLLKQTKKRLFSDYLKACCLSPHSYLTGSTTLFLRFRSRSGIGNQANIRFQAKPPICAARARITSYWSVRSKIASMVGITTLDRFSAMRSSKGSNQPENHSTPTNSIKYSENSAAGWHEKMTAMTSHLSQHGDHEQSLYHLQPACTDCMHLINR